MKFISTLKFFIPLLPLLFTACTPTYYFKIDAINSGEIAPKGSFYLVSGDPELKENDLRFREVAKHVRTAMEGKGYHIAESLPASDMLVEIVFGMGEPREVLDVRHQAQTYWQPGYSYAVQVPIVDKSGTIIGHRSRIITRPPRSHTYWDEYLDKSTLYEKELTLTAYDNKLGSSNAEPMQLWSLTVVNDDHSDDLRTYIPYMVAAAIPYIGQDTKKSILKRVQQDDEEVQFLLNP